MDIVQDKTFKWIYASLFFLTIGFLASPTVVSLYHILIFIPAIIVYKKKIYSINIPKSGWFLLALFGWGIICTTYNIDTIIKPRKSYDDLKFYFLGVFLIIPLRYYFDRVNSFQVRKLLNILYFIIIAAFIVGCIKAFGDFDIIKWQAKEFKNRSGGFTNYMRYGYSHAFMFILGVGLWINRRNLKDLIQPNRFLFILILCLLAIFTSKTRGALLAVMVGLPWLMLKYRPKIAAGIIGAGAIFVGVVIYISVYSNSSNRFLDINDGSNKKRMSQFYSAWKVIQEKPVFGLGSDQFSYNVPKIKEKYDIWSKEYQGHSHNIFLEHGANFGVLGILLLLGFLVTWLIEMILTGTDFSWAISSYIVAYTVAGQVELLFDNTNSHLLFFIYTLSQVYRQSKLERLNSYV
jgi:O-antigen ligase